MVGGKAHGRSEMRYRIIFETVSGPIGHPWLKPNDLDGAKNHATSYLAIHKALSVRVEDENGQVLFMQDA